MTYLPDVPEIYTANALSTTYGGHDFTTSRRLQVGLAGGAMGNNEPHWEKLFQAQQLMAQTEKTPTPTPKENKPMANPTPACRLVRVIVVDPHDSVPMAERVLFMGEEKMTDATDEELFFEIAGELNSKLKAHNDKRVTYTEKKNAADPEKAKKLEPARIRDLKMTVVNIAAF